FAHQPFAVRAGDVLHDVVRGALADAVLVQANDVRVVELAQRLDLALEALEEDRVAGLVRGQDFDRGDVRRRLADGPGAPNGAHRPAAQLRLDHPPTQSCADHV